MFPCAVGICAVLLGPLGPTLALSIADLNDATKEEFVALLSDVFENASWVPERTAQRRPFLCVNDLFRNMLQVVNAADVDVKLQLVQAYPDTADLVKLPGTANECETAEQPLLEEFGLLSLGQRQYIEFQSRNAAYRKRFGFPFVISLRDEDNGLDGIFEQLRRRLANSVDKELGEAIRQIGLMARHKLRNLVSANKCT